MKTLKDYTSGKCFRKVEIINNAECLPRDADFITEILDEKTMIRYAIYEDNNGFLYAINQDDEE